MRIVSPGAAWWNPEIESGGSAFRGKVTRSLTISLGAPTMRSNCGLKREGLRVDAEIDSKENENQPDQLYLTVPPLSKVWLLAGAAVRCNSNRGTGVSIRMWVLLPLLAILFSDAAFAQTEPEGASATLPVKPSEFFLRSGLCFTAGSVKCRQAVALRRSTSSFLSHFTIESFGLGSAPVEPGYMFSSAYIATFYNLQGLECPVCIPGPRNLARLTLPPFGATATVKH